MSSRTDSLRSRPEGWALVTGASSGIGESFARALAGLGYGVVLTGRREKELSAVASSLSTDRVVRHTVELTDDRQVDGLIQVCRGLEIDFLVNNAGFGVGNAYLDADLGPELGMEKVHAVAPMRLIHALVPPMRDRGRGYVVNVASLAAFFPLPGSATYSASKAFLRVFTESLAVELRGTGVRCQALCPGFTRSDFHARLPVPDSSLQDRGAALWMTSEAVVSASLRALTRNRVVCVPGLLNRLVRHVGSWIPRRLYYAAVSGLRRP